jgi:hypothetical protein
MRLFTEKAPIYKAFWHVNNVNAFGAKRCKIRFFVNAVCKQLNGNLQGSLQESSGRTLGERLGFDTQCQN